MLQTQQHPPTDYLFMTYRKWNSVMQRPGREKTISWLFTPLPSCHLSLNFMRLLHISWILPSVSFTDYNSGAGSFAAPSLLAASLCCVGPVINDISTALDSWLHRAGCWTTHWDNNSVCPGKYTAWRKRVGEKGFLVPVVLCLFIPSRWGVRQYFHRTSTRHRVYILYNGAGAVCAPRRYWQLFMSAKHL